VSPFAPWQPLRARSDELNLGGISVDGPGAAIVRDAISRLYARIRELEEKNEELERHLNPPPVARIVVSDELGPDLELYNLADPSCEGCGGLGVVEVGVETLGEEPVRLVRSACSCTGPAGR